MYLVPGADIVPTEDKGEAHRDEDCPDQGTQYLHPALRQGLATHQQEGDQEDAEATADHTDEGFVFSGILWVGGRHHQQTRKHKHQNTLDTKQTQRNIHKYADETGTQAYSDVQKQIKSQIRHTARSSHRH